jgi:protein-tyrosine phosphatase
MGNICRSPTAEGVFRHLVQQADLADAIRIDSAGTHAYHTGEPPDRRAADAALRRGFSMTELRARRVADTDFDEFDVIIAMDNDNVMALEAVAPEQHHGKIRLFLEFSSREETEVPDPYYGGAIGFEKVLDLVEDAAEGLLDAIQQQRL